MGDVQQVAFRLEPLELEEVVLVVLLEDPDADVGGQGQLALEQAQVVLDVGVLRQRAARQRALGQLASVVHAHGRPDLIQGGRGDGVGPLVAVA